MNLSVYGRYRLPIAVSALVLSVAVSGCGTVSGGSTSKATSSSTTPKVKTITYVNPRPSYPAFNTAGECIKKQAKKYGWTAKEVGTPGTAIDNQSAVNLISQATASGTNGLIIVPLVDELFAPVIKQARAKGIYVVGMNSGDSTNGQQAEVGTDNTQMGALMADGLGKKDPAAKVGFLSVSAATTAQQQIIEGFKAEAQKHFPSMAFVASVYDNGDATQDVDLANNTLAAHPDINAFFPLNGSALSAVTTAVKESGRSSKVTVIGLDLNDANQALIESGALYGVGDQGWCEMGTRSVEAIKDLSDGAKVKAFYPTKSTFITESNLPAS